MGIIEEIDSETEFVGEEEYVKFSKAILKRPPNSCRRMILIDGANLMHSGSYTGNKIMDLKGMTDKLNSTAILGVVYEFLRHGFEVMVLMKRFFSENKNSDNNFVLKELQRLEVLRFIDDGINDDMVLLRSAEFYGAAFISRDKFRQKEYGRFPNAKSRVIDYEISRREVTMDEKDLLEIPSTFIDLVFNIKFKNFNCVFAIQYDSDFNKVQNIYNQYQRSGALNNTFSDVNILIDFLQCEYSSHNECPIPALPYLAGIMPERTFRKFKKKYEAFVEHEVNFNIIRNFHDSMLKL